MKIATHEANEAQLTETLAAADGIKPTELDIPQWAIDVREAMPDWGFTPRISVGTESNGTAGGYCGILASVTGPIPSGMAPGSGKPIGQGKDSGRPVGQG